MQDFASWAVQYRGQAGHKLSPQLALAAFQFLSTSVDPFKPDWISENVLHRLIQQGMVVRYIRVKSKDKTDADLEAEFIYRQVLFLSMMKKRLHLLNSNELVNF